MLSLLFLFGRLIPVAHAVVLENAGSWTATGQPNPGVMMMWVRICSVLPFCSVGPAAPAFFITKLIHFVFLAIGGVAVLVILYAGIKLVVSQGSDEALGEAKTILLYAVGGIVLSLLGNALMDYIANAVLNQALR